MPIPPYDMAFSVIEPAVNDSSDRVDPQFREFVGFSGNKRTDPCVELTLIRLHAYKHMPGCTREQ